MTNRQGPSWQDVVANQDKNQPPEETLQGESHEDLMTLLIEQLSRMSSAYETRGVRRTFCVTEHKKIGLENAPILMTATRIK
jgi:hypothetical protein